MVGAGSPGGEGVVRVGSAEAQIDVSVEDDGPGIATGLSLFAQFETNKSGGMGLGLSICQSIIEAHGGRIWHEVSAAPGTRFRFTLPIGKPAPQPAV